MATVTHNVTSTLNGLIETCKDGEQGFRQAAEKVQDPSLRSLFTRYSTQRAEYARNLQQLVTTLGDSPAESGHVAATLHRGWIGLKSALSKNEDKAIIDECEAGEDAAIEAYKAAIANQLPANIDQVVRTQYAGVQAAHETIRNLKHNKASIHAV
jgi:uncharacterized protein (TIGR02284 family)